MQPEKTCPIMPKNLTTRYQPLGNGRDLYIPHTENSPAPHHNPHSKLTFSHDFKIYSSSRPARMTAVVVVVVFFLGGA